MPIIHKDLGLAGYKEVWDLQKATHLEKQKGSTEDILYTVEHNHVYTLGKTGSRDHILISDDEMKARGISYYEIDRGGDITYHGPGQLVVYPILDLHNYYKDTHRYLRALEETVMLTLKEMGIEAHREEEFTGVWVGEEKICAIGIKVSRWITMHGIAFNVNTDLSYFDKIIPCGIFHKGVTSIEKLTGKKANMTIVKEMYIKNFLQTFESHQNS
ncbi:MAG TPA: lipoyl(octanoyl) transferase LipB [Ignavibacteria bacterium]|nr:lipoyl(octanoyl) transferase LipB [Ignavibacteria bacterium]HMQ98291.1 lipoyl(octanoyl) transferase LipB [Ignavibacteria bacterium]